MYELRWFFPGSGSAPARQWLTDLAAGQVEADPLRREVYLRYRPDIGVKISRGGLELKQRFDTPVLLALAGGVTGMLEYWEKVEWKYADKASQDDPVYRAFATGQRAGERVTTEKTRLLGKFEARADVVAPVARSARPDVGLLVEVADVSMAGRPSWWTLQFELVAAKGASNEPALRRAVDWALAQKWPDRAALTGERSMGYPELLERIRAAR